jgi:hypothetical protein
MGCGQPKNSLKEAMKSFSQILMVTSQSGISFGILNAGYVYINLYLSIIFGIPDRGRNH